MLLRRKSCIVFTTEDLNWATDNYNESRVFNRDTNEPVYKGILLEDRERRLKIATKTANSLSYLHSSSEAPITHGDINSSNMLLDHGYTVKVSSPSFTGLLGTDGEKSDVYNFDVILAELLTGDEVLNSDRPRGKEFLTERRSHVGNS
ncbi:Serine threonine kinase [Olea europaea subsp. europaea]|uniref:Serine threonine kinase n=1 Tax=Olea europaea subsp. europaea TaxID=158383 RepID=A0A8S0Q875_OLEEU|nr:Serine threonine kinase [Olea europaea subsp. europaea]